MRFNEEIEMGCFDTVMVPCPKCGVKSGFQSKGGECYLATYELADCPKDVLSDVNRHAPNTCEECGTIYAVMSTEHGPVSYNALVDIDDGA